MAETNKSQLISEAELIEAINADSIISVSLGAGQPQKNVKLSTLASVVAGLIPTATFTRKGLASVDMVNVLPKSTNTNNANTYMEVFNHPMSFKGAFILISGFQDSTISESVSLVLCRSHNDLSAPTVIPLHGSSARLTMYGVLSGSKVRYCVHVPSAYMHIQSISLHPLGISLLDVVSDVSSWTRLG